MPHVGEKGGEDECMHGWTVMMMMIMIRASGSSGDCLFKKKKSKLTERIL